MKKEENQKMTKTDELLKITNNTIKKIKKMNLSKEILLSLNFKDLIENLLENELKDANDIYSIIDYIVDNYTSLDSNKSPLLWLGVKKDGHLLDAVNYIASFNFQMAQYFDKSII